MDDWFKNLNVLRNAKVLGSHWMKLDYVSEIEVIFIYYNIEPIDLVDMIYPPESYIRAIDEIQLYEVMKRSSIPFVQGRGIPLKEFIQFLREKEISIPAHLRGLEKTKQKSSDEDDVEGSNRKSKRAVQLQKEFARIYAEFQWKKSENSKLSANELVKRQGFKSAMKLIDAGSMNEDTHAEWISDLSPRSKKMKNNPTSLFS